MSQRTSVSSRGNIAHPNAARGRALRRGAVVAGVALMLCLTGCGADGADAESGDVPASAASLVSPARWAVLQQDLDARGEHGAVTFVSAKAMTWPNSALGCPRPGVVVTPGTVHGVRVIAESEGVEYDYRFGKTDVPVLCSGVPVTSEPTPSPSD